MGSKLLVSVAVMLVSLSCAAQVTPAAKRIPLNFSAGGGVGYWSGDWGRADINKWGPSAWATVSIWRNLSIIAEGHSMDFGGRQLPYKFDYYTAGGGLTYISDYYGRFQPYLKAEAAFASLTHLPNASGRLHHTSNIWTIGGGVEYHTWGHLWTRVDYSYDLFPNFHSSITNQNHTLDPRGISFGETYRFGPAGTRF